MGLTPHQLTKANAFQKLIQDKKAGLGVPHLFQADLREFEIPFPPLPEQRRIAEILDILDEAIRRTEQVIAKLQQMKQGLLHDLLTRGIDEHGELRDPERHPEQFKDSPLGRIPRGWEVAKFGHLALSAVLGTAVRGAAKLGRNIPLLKMGNLGWGRIDPTNVELVAKTRVTDWKTLRLHRGDLLFNTRNTPELVGKTAVWNNELLEAVADNNILRVRFRPEVNGFFVGAYMSHGAGKAQVHRLAMGTTSVAAIYWKNLRDYLLPLPSNTEQNRAVTSLQYVDARLKREATQLAKLRTLKHGLMDDLLTGRVRVTKKLLEYCRVHKHDVQFVVFYNITRFSRNSHDFAIARTLLQRLGISLRSVNEPLSDDPVGNLTGNILAAIGQFDNDEKARRTVAGMLAALELGRWPFQAPIGYLTGGPNGRGILIPDPDRASLMKLAFEEIGTGHRSRPEVLRG